MANDLSPDPLNHDKAFALAVGLNVVLVAVEAGYGFAAGSLALLADAGHNLSDVLSLLLAWTATWLARKEPSARRTYGLGRSTILASLVNAVILLIAVGGIAWEALGRLADPRPVAGGTVVVVALVATVINVATALLFMRGSRDDLNVRGAFLHMAADAGVSLGVVAAAGVIAATGALWIDPVVSLAIAAVIAVSTWGLLRDSVNLSLDAVPRSIDLEEVRSFLLAAEGVVAVHDLHVWALSTTSTALTAHLVKPDAKVDDELLARLNRELLDRFGIDHATIQLETSCETEAICPQHASHE